jgi:hypothetical protein
VKVVTGYWTPDGWVKVTISAVSERNANQLRGPRREDETWAEYIARTNPPERDANQLADTYVVGKPGTKYAVTRRSRGNSEWSLPWRKPNGGWKVGRFIVWWSA